MSMDYRVWGTILERYERYKPKNKLRFKQPSSFCTL